jgi:methylase of polypeptide subunit release factors
MNKELTIRYGAIDVVYEGLLDGGGTSFGQQYVPVVRNHFGRVGHLFEFCAGPGFIGFSLLAHGLCDKLTLADINPDAVALCRETVRRNKLEDRVSVYVSDGLKDIPESEKWDLVVGNPPHFVCEDERTYAGYIRRYDPNLRIHKEFYKDISRHLAPKGVVLLQENREGMPPELFTDMINENGLIVRQAFTPTTEELAESRSIVTATLKVRHNYAKLLNPWAVYRYARGLLTRKMRTENPFYFLEVARKSAA